MESRFDKLSSFHNAEKESNIGRSIMSGNKKASILFIILFV
jgi:hypothetical protein